MYTDVYEKLKRKNQILFTRDSVCLQRLLAKMGEQNDRTLVLWALECCRVPVKRLKEHFPEDERPQRALEASTMWSMGKIKMPEAKKAILQVHAMTKDVDSPEDAALCHAVGQGCSTVHTRGHAIGLPMYELTALVRLYGVDEARLDEKIEYYVNQLDLCMVKEHTQPRLWAPFLLK